VDVVVPGDRLLVGTGEVIPVDGRLVSSAVLDESALTGESLPVERVPGDVVRSGVVNAGGPSSWSLRRRRRSRRMRASSASSGKPRRRLPHLSGSRTGLPSPSSR
jgi:P-type E1-E2 ATPase